MLMLVLLQWLVLMETWGSMNTGLHLLCIDDTRVLVVSEASASAQNLSPNAPRLKLGVLGVKLNHVIISKSTATIFRKSITPSRHADSTQPATHTTSRPFATHWITEWTRVLLNVSGRVASR
mmetsp:Transcript_13229/g.25719  ORF Transcript_13229/g.25719 Transcript_13229/m.25719 type:complete len:122 (-) Transcript_13229:207-572(-)